MNKADETTLLHIVEAAHQIRHNILEQAVENSQELDQLPDSLIPTAMLYSLSVALLSVTETLEKQALLDLSSVRLTNRNIH